MVKTLREKFFSRFSNMKTRCYNPNCKSYRTYGWRWIKVERESREDFYNDMRESFEKHVKKYGIDDTTIDRIDVNWNYCKENCRWVTRKWQIENKRTVTPVIYKGKKYVSIKSLADEKWIDNRLIRERMKRWWDIERAVDTPPEDRKGIKLIRKGKEYKSQRALARYLWISEDRISRGLRHWFTLEESIIKKTSHYKNRHLESNQ